MTTTKKVVGSIVLFICISQGIAHATDDQARILLDQEIEILEQKGKSAAAAYDHALEQAAIQYGKEYKQAIEEYIAAKKEYDKTRYAQGVDTIFTGAPAEYSKLYTIYEEINKKYKKAIEYYYKAIEQTYNKAREIAGASYEAARAKAAVDQFVAMYKAYEEYTEEVYKIKVLYDTAGEVHDE